MRDEVDESGEGMSVTDDSTMNFGRRRRRAFRGDGREILIEEVDNVDDGRRESSRCSVAECSESPGCTDLNAVTGMRDESNEGIVESLLYCWRGASEASKDRAGFFEGDEEGLFRRRRLSRHEGWPFLEVKSSDFPRRHDLTRFTQELTTNDVR